MNEEEINVAIAEACGWKPEKNYWLTPEGCEAFAWDIPNYSNNLNSMHEAEQTLKRMGPEYSRILLDIVSRDAGVGVQYAHGSFAHIKATARQRAEAFLRTLGKWEEAQ
jgi:hypothetical protein